MISLGGPERAALLALADDEHLMGQRHTEWIGVAPFLEEDLAFASIGQDELGHAAALYELLDPDADALAFGRPPADYRSCWLVELPCTDWAEALVRHWLYDEAELLRWQGLAESSVPDVRGVAARSLGEETYHRRHAVALLDALAGDRTAMARIEEAFTRLAPVATALFDPPFDAVGADPAVVGPSLDSLLPTWTAVVTARFAVAPPNGADVGAAQRGRTVRSEHFGEVYGRMREVMLLDPTADW